MKKIIVFSLILITALVVEGCNKTKKFSKRLAGEKWTVTELSVAGINESELPVLSFNDCDIYDESCKGEWETPEHEHAEFVWQIRDKGGLFELSNQSSLDEIHSHSGDDHAAEEAIIQCQNFSGVYTIVSSKRKSMELESQNTLGHSGQLVKMKLELK